MYNVYTYLHAYFTQFYVYVRGQCPGDVLDASITTRAFDERLCFSKLLVYQTSIMPITIFFRLQGPAIFRS